jgi:hypothetical protein
VSAPRWRRPDLLTSCFTLATVVALSAIGVRRATGAPFPLLARMALGRLGHASSAVAVGLAYGAGRDVPRDDARALAWFERAAARGDAEATVYVADASLDHSALLGPASVRALELYRRAADAGDGLGAWRYGVALVRGVGTPADPTAAAPWLEAAIEWRERTNRNGAPFEDLAPQMWLASDDVIEARLISCPLWELAQLREQGVGGADPIAEAVDLYRRISARRPPGPQTRPTLADMAASRVRDLVGRRPDLRRQEDVDARRTGEADPDDDWGAAWGDDWGGSQ